MSKYHNRKVEIDGIKFDSIKEGERYLELKICQIICNILNCLYLPCAAVRFNQCCRYAIVIVSTATGTTTASTACRSWKSMNSSGSMA